MATRREPDSQQPPRSAAPPAPAPTKKSRKAVPAAAEPLAATPAVDAAVNAALEDALVATAPVEKTKKRRPAAKKGQAVITATKTPTVSEDERRGMIALSAYLRAERRGFSPEGEAEDWLAAEKEVDALLNSGLTKPQ